MNNKPLYRTCVGGILLLITSIFGTISTLTSVIWNFLQYNAILKPEYLARYLTPERIFFILGRSLPTILTSLAISLPILLFAVLLVMKKHGKPLVIAAIIMLVCQAATVFYSAGTMLFGTRAIMPASIVSLFSEVVACGFPVTLMLLCIKAAKVPEAGRKLKLLPVLLRGLALLLSLISAVAINLLMNYGFGRNVIITLFTSLIPSLIGGVFHCVIWFLVCGWIVNPWKSAPKAAYPTQYPPQYRPQQGYQAPQYPPQQPQYPQYPQQNYPPQNQNPYQNR